MDASLPGQLGGAGEQCTAVPRGGSFLVPAGCDLSRAGVQMPVLWPVDSVLGMSPVARWQPSVPGMRLCSDCGLLRTRLPSGQPKDSRNC